MVTLQLRGDAFDSVVRSPHLLNGGKSHSASSWLVGQFVGLQAGQSVGQPGGKSVSRSISGWSVNQAVSMSASQ